MKKIIITLSIVAAAFHVSAQQSGKIQFGFRAGLNTAYQTSVVDNVYTATKIKAGITGGFYAEIPIMKRLSIQPELLYSELGGIDTNQSYLDVTSYCNYLVIPVKVKYNTGLLTFYAGPQFGYLLNAHMIPQGQKEIDTKEFLNTSEIASVFGIDFNIADGVTAGIGYQMGMSNIFKDDDEDINDDWLHNNAFQFSFAVRLTGNKK